MARTREFDETEALGRALETFWAKGYEMTSIQDLVTSTGVNRQSLYNTFGDKEELFEKAFNEYCRQMDLKIGSILLQEAPVSTILSDYKRATKDAVVTSGGRGCFVVCTIVNTEGICERVKERAKEIVAKRDQALEAIFQRGQKEGVVTKRHTPKILAQMFHATIIGLSVLDKSRFGVEEIENIIDAAFDALK
jgi:TetR/AcrR family transcriptional repressor of nem operon